MGNKILAVFCHNNNLNAIAAFSCGEAGYFSSIREGIDACPDLFLDDGCLVLVPCACVNGFLALTGGMSEDV